MTVMSKILGFPVSVFTYKYTPESFKTWEVVRTVDTLYKVKKERN